MSTLVENNSVKMAGSGAGVLTSLKNKMQHLREELEKYKDLYEDSCEALQEEQKKRAEVGVVPSSSDPQSLGEIRWLIPIVSASPYRCYQIGYVCILANIDLDAILIRKGMFA